MFCFSEGKRTATFLKLMCVCNAWKHETGCELRLTEVEQSTTPHKQQQQQKPRIHHKDKKCLK